MSELSAFHRSECPVSLPLTMATLWSSLFLLNITHRLPIRSRAMCRAMTATASDLCCTSAILPPLYDLPADICLHTSMAIIWHKDEQREVCQLFQLSMGLQGASLSSLGCRTCLAVAGGGVPQLVLPSIVRPAAPLPGRVGSARAAAAAVPPAHVRRVGARAAAVPLTRARLLPASALALLVSLPLCWPAQYARARILLLLDVCHHV